MEYERVLGPDGVPGAERVDVPAGSSRPTNRRRSTSPRLVHRASDDWRYLVRVERPHSDDGRSRAGLGLEELEDRSRHG